MTSEKTPVLAELQNVAVRNLYTLCMIYTNVKSTVTVSFTNIIIKVYGTII